MNLTDLSVSDLRRAAQLKEQIDALNQELLSILSGSGDFRLPSATSSKGGGRNMSAAGRARIAAAARARWARVRAQKGTSPTAAAKPGRRKMSAAGRAKIAAAARARWAKAKAAGKSRL